jgi:hypothetical protein
MLLPFLILVLFVLFEFRGKSKEVEEAGRYYYTLKTVFLLYLIIIL